MYFDCLTYLPDNNQVKLDRSAMSCGLETRSPFLDIDLQSYAWGIPIAERINGKRGKIPLRKILGNYLPIELIDKPKSGFAVPLASWLRGPLRNWAGSKLENNKIKEESFLNNEFVQRIWKEHLSNKYDHSLKLWNILMWEMWIEKFQ